MICLNVVLKTLWIKKFSMAQVAREPFPSMMPHVTPEVALIGETAVKYSTLERVDFSMDDIDVSLKMPTTVEMLATGLTGIAIHSRTVVTGKIHCPIFSHALNHLKKKYRYLC